MKSLENFAKVDLAEATVDQIRAFAAGFLNLDIEEKEKAESIKVKMTNAGWAMPFILLPSAAPSGPTGEERKQIQRRERPDGRMEVRIRIYSTDKPGGSDEVPVGVNGTVILIPRDKDVWVPEEYVLALQNAIEVTWPEYDAGKDFEGGLKEKDRREVQAYPFAYT